MARNVIPLSAVDGRARVFVGLEATNDCRRLNVAVLKITGSQHSIRGELLATSTAEAPRECPVLFQQLSTEQSPPAAAATLGASLANGLASLALEELRKLRIAVEKVSAAGVLDAGLWRFGDDGARGYQPLCDAAVLAEASGLNVVDAFPARDLACGGQGGPVTALAEWILLADPRETRVLVYLTGATRMTYLPAATRASAASEILSFDVGPGMRLLDALVDRLTSGAEQFDPGGRMAVQGKKIPELLAHWLADPYFDRALPRWHPWGVRPERYLMDALRMAIENDWSVRDMLCTATHLVAEAIGRAIERRLPRLPVIDRVILTGGGYQNGMLLRELSQRVGGAVMTRIADVGIHPTALAPACAAVLAACYLDGAAAGVISAPGRGAQILGRLTPGSRASWKRLVDQCASTLTPESLHRNAS